MVELDQVYREHVNDLYRYLYSLSKDHFIADDLVQEAFYQAYLHLEDYEISNIRAWLFKVAYHALKSRIAYIKKHGIKVYGAAITGPTEELRKLQNVKEISTMKVGEVKPWNWE